MMTVRVCSAQLGFIRVRSKVGGMGWNKGYVLMHVVRDRRKCIGC